MFRLDFAWPGPAPKAGQFFMVKPGRGSTFLGRPISTALWAPRPGTEDPFLGEKTLNFLVAPRGRGTLELLSMKLGEEAELTGPLGNCWEEFLPPFGKPGNIALIGGGVGIAPLLAFVQELSSIAALEISPRIFDLYAGFKTSFLTDEKAKARFFGPALQGPNELIIATEDGSEGFKGRVPDFLEPAKYSAVYACGPEAMLRAVAERCRTVAVPCYISMERRMACGVGACLGCTVETAKGNRRCCADGPIFPAEEIW
jgi:NAD(P)H-flavin reductase